jgi:hypothetical protein
MRDSYWEREVPIGVKEEHGDVNKADILGLTDDDILFQVHNIEWIIHNVDRHNDDDQYNNGEIVKYKNMIEDSKKPFYPGCAVNT